MGFVKKHWSNILFAIILVLLLIPQTGKPINIFVHRLIASSPTVKAPEKRIVLDSYDWVLEDESGTSVDFNSFKGKKIMVNFWATWCAPCVAEMPSMQALYDDYKNDVVFLFVTHDDKETVAKFMKSRDLNLPVYRAKTLRPEAFEGNSIPATYFINEKQEIVINKVGSADWNSEKVRELILE
ncbi:MAG: thiol-disulfide isomerase/thioredoxin [Bacteroidia bacterium]|jgi:thiol-disulfide isomerase/thioredoxin